MNHHFRIEITERAMVAAPAEVVRLADTMGLPKGMVLMSWREFDRDVIVVRGQHDGSAAANLVIQRLMALAQCGSVLQSARAAEAPVDSAAERPPGAVPREAQRARQPALRAVLPFVETEPPFVHDRDCNDLTQVSR